MPAGALFIPVGDPAIKVIDLIQGSFRTVRTP
jgi:hypothetical protein